MSGFASALSQRVGIASVNLSGAFSVDQQGNVVPSISFLDNLILPSVRAAVQQWLGTDAWQSTQVLTKQGYAADPLFTPTPDVAALYTATQTPLPQEAPKPAPKPARGRCRCSTGAACTAPT